MQYNTSRSRLLMKEYGRNVQSMVEYLLTIDDPEVRLRNARAVVELMGILNPHLRIVEDYEHKLWDHLYEMTDFTLQVDGPYPPPTAEEVRKKPEVLPYPQHRIRHRHLGRNLDQLLQLGRKETDPDKKQGFTQAIGYYMKLAYANWHYEPVHDDMIRNELRVLSEGEMSYEPTGFKIHVDQRSANNFKNGKSNKYKNRGGNLKNRKFKKNKGGGNWS